MDRIELTRDIDGRWSVTMPGLVLSDLTRVAAEAFVTAYRRVTGPRAARTSA